MIKRFRKKFIIITLLTLAFVEIIIIGTINGINAYNQNKDADELLTVLEENNGSFPDMHGDKDSAPGKPNDNDSKPEPPSDNRNMNVETKYVTRYFVVTVDSDNNIKNIDTGHIAAIDSSKAEEYAESALSSGKNKAYLGNYKYLISDKDNEKLVIFVDCRGPLKTRRQFLEVSIIIAVAAFAVFSILLGLISKKAVKPYIEAVEKQKRFITDAGHEIKTPLAIISANNEVLEMIHGESEWNVSIKHQVNRLSELVKQLVTMSKMDEDINPVFSEFNISDAVYDSASSFVTLAASKNKHAEIKVTDDLMYTGDEGMIRQLVSVLMDNAVKYADDGGEILISLVPHGKSIKLSVYNTCENPPEGDLNLLFDRFYRADSSRSRETGGYGIGLSIARSIVELHKGKITAKVENGGVLFEAILKSK